MSPTGGRLLASVLGASVCGGWSTGAFIDLLFVTFYLNTMADFNPDSADKRLVLQALAGTHQRILDTITQTEPRGFVSWESNSTEKDFYRALQTGLAFLRTDCTDEWCVLGNGVFALVRPMDIFHEVDTVEIACGLIYAGTIRKMKVYLRLWPEQPSTEFFIGHRNQCVRAIAVGVPFAIADEQHNERNDARAHAIDPNMLPDENDPNRVYEEEVHRQYEAAAAAVQRDREQQANDAPGSPIWRALQGTVDKWTDRLAGE